MVLTTLTEKRHWTTKFLYKAIHDSEFVLYYRLFKDKSGIFFVRGWVWGLEVNFFHVMRYEDSENDTKRNRSS